jgi:hypothetical protein
MNFCCSENLRNAEFKPENVAVLKVIWHTDNTDSMDNADFICLSTDCCKNGIFFYLRKLQNLCHLRAFETASFHSHSKGKKMNFITHQLKLTSSGAFAQSKNSPPRFCIMFFHKF